MSKLTGSWRRQTARPGITPEERKRQIMRAATSHAEYNHSHTKLKLGISKRKPSMPKTPWDDDK